MFSRTRLALVFAVVLSVLPFFDGLAKGGFDYIAVTGADLEEAVRFTDPALTEDFFAFANFYEDRIAAPVDPGEGYEVIRYYIDGNRNIPFDRLHYYPETGFVFYDGIENGESEYDGEWYTARPEIKTVFESALSGQGESALSVEENQPISGGSETVHPGVSSQPTDSALAVWVMVAASGIAALLLLAFWRRRLSIR